MRLRARIRIRCGRCEHPYHDKAVHVALTPLPGDSPQSRILLTACHVVYFQDVDRRSHYLHRPIPLTIRLAT